jgi:hypothetical protein
MSEKYTRRHRRFEIVRDFIDDHHFHAPEELRPGFIECGE